MLKSLFRVNDYISLVLKGDEIKIMVKGVEFMICKGVVVNIPVMKLDDMQELFYVI